MPIGMPGWPEFAFCTASMASARIALASSTREFIRIPSRGGTAKSGNYNAGSGPPRSSLLVFAVEPDAELLQLAIKMRAFETDRLGDAADVSAFLRDVVLEVHPLERVPRVAQRKIERQSMRGGRRQRHRRWLRQNASDVLERDLVAQRGERKRLHHTLQLGEIAGPVVVAQRIECRGADLTRRYFFRFDHAREDEIREVGHVLPMFAQARDPYRRHRERGVEARVESALRDHVG